MLRSIKTENFKKLVNGTYEFTDGLNIICGDNAAGKTTLTQALSFALYGVRAIPGKSEDIATWGEKNAKVTCSLGDFEIIRTINNCSVKKGGELVASGNTPSNDYIVKELANVDLNGFKMLNWSEQGETAGLLTIGATQLQRDVEKFSGVEFIDSVIKLASQDIIGLEREVELFESQGGVKTVSKLLKQAEKDSATLKLDKEECETTLAHHQTSKAASKVREAAIRKQLTEAEELRSEKAVIQERLDAASVSYDDNKVNLIRLESQLTEIREISESDYRERKDALEKAKQEIQVAGEKNERMQTLLINAEDAKPHIKSDKKLIDAEEKAVHAFDSKNQELEKLEHLYSGLESQAADLKKAIESGICKCCGQDIASQDTLEKHRASLSSLESDMEEIQAQYSVLEAEVLRLKAESDAAISARTSGYKNWAVKAKQWSEEAAELADELASTTLSDPSSIEREEVDLETLRTQLAERRGLVSNINIVKQEMDKLKIRVDSNSTKMSEIVEALRKISVSESDLNTVLTDLELADQAIDSLNPKLVKLSTDLAKAEASVQNWKTVLEDEKKFEASLKEVKTLKSFVKYLKESRVKFLSSVWVNILSTASDFLNQATSGKITALSKDEKRGFMFCEDGTYAPVAAASGAQKGFIGVAVRLALSSSLRASMPLVVLDEPTESMREENAMRLSGALLGHGQVLMVTHRESDRGVAANVIEM